MTDKKHKKKLKRGKKKKKDKAQAHEAEQRLSKKVNMFDRIPEACSACDKTFPKTREAHDSWLVTVFNDRKLVRLFCPECQQEFLDSEENNNEI